MHIKHLAAVTVGLALTLSACGDDDAETTVASTTVEASADRSDESSEESSEESSDEELSGEIKTGDRAEEASGEEELSGEITTGDRAEEASEEAAATTTEPSESSDEPAALESIISLSPTATEMLYAIDAGDQVLAVDDFSNFPEEAADKMQGLSGFEPNVESIAGLEPDLVITDGTNQNLLDQLDTLGIAHWEGPAAISFDDVYTQIEQLGAATGHVAEAAELVANMQADVEQVKQDLPQLDEALTYYHELDDTYFSVTSDTFIGAVYSEIGLVNIADGAGIDSPYPQLNAEYIIDQNPDLIFLACTKYCGITADSVASRPGWENIAAVQNGGVVEMDDDVASRWGPRIVEYFQLAGEAVAAASVAQPVG